MSLIEINNLGISFQVTGRKHSSLKHVLIERVRRKNRKKTFWALRQINITVEQGDVLGIIGANGAGKTTLCTAMSGIYEPDEGSIQVNGHVVPILSLGVGVNPFMTGRENIYLCGLMMGFTRQFLQEMEESILEFAEIDEFADEPLRSYSTGMGSRLAFAIATCAEPDILILDEVFSVGDAAFQEKSRERTESLRHHAKAVLLVSHSNETIRHFCTKAIWLNHGQQMAFGPVEEVVEKYERWISQKSGKSAVLPQV